MKKAPALNSKISSFNRLRGDIFHHFELAIASAMPARNGGECQRAMQH